MSGAFAAWHARSSACMPFTRLAGDCRYHAHPHHAALSPRRHIGAPLLTPDGLTGWRNVPSMTSTGPEVLITFDQRQGDSLSDGSRYDSFLFGWSSAVKGSALPSGQCGRRCLAGLRGDGVCTPECMNEACGWDDGDCWATCGSRSEWGSTCYATQLGDGHCDPECMIDECGFDHDDCTCQTVLSGRYGFRASGGPQADYKTSLSRCWLIQPKPSPGATISSITLTFQRFDTEEYFDVVRVFDGSFDMASNQLNVGGMTRGYSGSLHVESLPPLTATRYPSMLVTFESDASIGADGFLFGWTSTERGVALPAGNCAIGCRAAMRGDGHCDAACMNAACAWDAKSAIEGRTGSGDTDQGDCQRECYPGCRQEQLNNGVCEPACATAECGYDAADCGCENVLTACEGAATDGSDSDTRYSRGAYRCFLLRPQHNDSRVHLRWERFDTEAGRDLVHAYDGASKLDVPLHTGAGWSGSDLPPPISSSGASMLITFNADSYLGSKGFRFSWRCSGSPDVLYEARQHSNGHNDQGSSGHSSHTVLTPNLLRNPAMIEGWQSRESGWTVYRVRPNAPLATAWQHDLISSAVQSPGATSGYKAIESTSLLGTCCIVRSHAQGAQMIATSSQGMVREQEIDLLALGFTSDYLDSMPPIHVSERFAQLPPGLHDEYLLRVELQDASHQVLTHWQLGSDAQRASPPQCSAMCQLRRRDGSGFWINRTHVFSNYGRGVRYVRWRDGGRDGDAYDGHTGALLDSPSLTLTLDPARGCAVSCGQHGTCVAGECVCETDWQGMHCATPRHPTCPLNCSGRGVCSMRDGFAQCTCHGDSVGSYCTRHITELQGGHTCPDGTSSALRRGIDLTLRSRNDVALMPHPGFRMRQSARTLQQTTLVQNGLVLPDWALASARLASNRTESLSFDISVKTPVKATFGDPFVHIDDPGIVSSRISSRYSKGAKTGLGDSPLGLDLTCECLSPGITRMSLSIPMDEFCSISVSWTKVCLAPSSLANTH